MHLAEQLGTESEKKKMKAHWKESCMIMINTNTNTNAKNSELRTWKVVFSDRVGMRGSAPHFSSNRAISNAFRSSTGVLAIEAVLATSCSATYGQL